MQIAEQLGLRQDEVEQYGPYKAKVRLEAIERLSQRPEGAYVVVTAITPTPLGEGKTTTTVGLAQGLSRLGHRAICTTRQPSLGPVFGIKGGGTGGGRSQMLPVEDINIHFTGDMHAVAAAHNLLASFVDNHLHHGTLAGLDPRDVAWRRVMDVNDRALREIVLGLGGTENAPPRESGFDITAASEVMAILALASSTADLRARLGRIVVGFDRDGRPLSAEDARGAGGMAVLLRDALKPNLVQTLEGTPALVHAGPFGNIAHGCSSIVADELALKLADFTVTEAGFGADLGFEKFCDIKCRVSGKAPRLAVVVCTIRALKAHSGRFKIVAGRPLDPALVREDLAAVEEGSANLVKQIENVRAFGIPAVVAINRFPTDTDAEMALVQRVALEAGAVAAEVSDHHARGGEGAEALARAVVQAASLPSAFQLLYPDTASLRDKIETIATRIYGAAGVTLLPAAERSLRRFTDLGYGHLPVCIAKTHLSLSHDPALKNRPSGFTVPVREAYLSAGAGFIYVLLGDMRTMPGLGRTPSGYDADLDVQGNVVGLFD